VSWPATQVALTFTDWRGTYLLFAAVLALVAAPLHAFALPRTSAARSESAAPKSEAPVPALLPASGMPLLLVIAAFASYAFVPAGLLAHLLAMFSRLGLEPATAVAVGALFGPSQMIARLCEYVFAREVHPLNIARFAVATLLLGFAMLFAFNLSVATAAAFMILLGLCNGLITIARGTVPLTLFGHAGYGRLIGRIAGPSLAIQSAAPLVLAIATERISDLAALAMAGALLAVALACFLAVPRPV
jgi:hypothetical protein